MEIVVALSANLDPFFHRYPVVAPKRCCPLTSKIDRPGFPSVATGALIATILPVDRTTDHHWENLLVPPGKPLNRTSSSFSFSRLNPLLKIISYCAGKKKKKYYFGLVSFAGVPLSLSFFLSFFLSCFLGLYLIFCLSLVSVFSFSPECCFFLRFIRRQELELSSLDVKKSIRILLNFRMTSVCVLVG